MRPVGAVFILGVFLWVKWGTGGEVGFGDVGFDLVMFGFVWGCWFWFRYVVLLNVFSPARRAAGGDFLLRLLVLVWSFGFVERFLACAASGRGRSIVNAPYNPRTLLWRAPGFPNVSPSMVRRSAADIVSAVHRG